MSKEAPENHHLLEEKGANEHSFDELARGLGTGTLSRRGVLKLIGAAILGSVLGFSFDRRASFAQQEAVGQPFCTLVGNILGQVPDGSCILCTGCLVCCGAPTPEVACPDRQVLCENCNSVPCPRPPVAANAGETFASADIQQASAASGDVTASAPVELESGTIIFEPDIIEGSQITFTPAP